MMLAGLVRFSNRNLIFRVIRIRSLIFPNFLNKFILETCKIKHNFPGAKVSLPPSCISPLYLMIFNIPSIPWQLQLRLQQTWWHPPSYAPYNFMFCKQTVGRPSGRLFSLMRCIRWDALL
jgi:hypothetical protein